MENALLSTGDPNILGSWLSLSTNTFGPDSAATKFIKGKIADSFKGEDEPVLANEAQLLQVLMALHLKGEQA